MDNSSEYYDPYLERKIIELEKRDKKLTWNRWNQTCVKMKNHEFLKWIGDRLVYVLHDASEDTDYIQRLRSITEEVKRHEEPE